MKKYIKYLLLIVFLMSTINSYAQWQKMFEIYANINQFASNTNYVFCGTGPTGVFRSSNSGITWDPVNSGLANKNVYTITAQDNYIFVGTDSGLFRSTNNGNNWSRIHQNIYSIFVYHLDCNEQYVFAGTIKGLFRSSNQGITWDSINTGLPYLHGRVYINAITSFNDTLYVGVGVDNGTKKVYKTINNGNNWKTVLYSDFDSVVVYSMQAKDNVVLCGTHKGVFLSNNSGSSWRRINEINNNIGLFGLSILDNNNILISSFGYGVQVSTNGGANWVFKNEGIIPDEYYACALYSIGGMTYLGTRPFSYLPAIYRRNTSQLIPVVENNIIIPEDIELYQNYPNPFNPSTKIKFSVPQVRLLYGGSSPHEVGGDLVQLKVYDIMGREVQTLVNELLKPGTYEVTFDGEALTSGVYFYKLQCGDFVQTNRMVLIK